AGIFTLSVSSAACLRSSQANLPRLHEFLSAADQAHRLETWDGLELSCVPDGWQQYSSDRTWDCDGSESTTTSSAARRLHALRSRSIGRAKEATMIRKLKSGGYRLYSRKTNPKTGRRRNLGRSRRARRRRSTNARCSISSAVDADSRPSRMPR